MGNPRKVHEIPRKENIDSMGNMWVIHEIS